MYFCKLTEFFSEKHGSRIGKSSGVHRDVCPAAVRNAFLRLVRLSAATGLIPVRPPLIPVRTGIRGGRMGHRRACPVTDTGARHIKNGHPGLRRMADLRNFAEQNQ